MPKIPIDYSKTIIYRFCCKDQNIQHEYIGHTTSWSKRKDLHKRRVKGTYGGTLYQTIRENGGWDNWDMIEVEKYACNDNNEARAREQYWIDNRGLGNLLNDINAVSTRESLMATKKKYYLKTREHHKEYMKQYHQRKKQV